MGPVPRQLLADAHNTTRRAIVFYLIVGIGMVIEFTRVQAQDTRVYLAMALVFAFFGAGSYTAFYSDYLDVCAPMRLDVPTDPTPPAQGVSTVEPTA